jgi:hypothetical protein
MAILAVSFSFPQAFANVTNNVNHVLAHIFDDTQLIEANTDNLLLAGLGDIVRISETIHDGADNRYSGEITFHRASGTGAYQIKQLYLCDIKLGVGHSGFYDVLIDGKRINVDGLISRGNLPVIGDRECTDLMFVSQEHIRLSLGGDNSHDIKLLMVELQTGGDDDSNGAELVAYVTGLNSPSDMSIDSTTDDT